MYSSCLLNFHFRCELALESEGRTSNYLLVDCPVVDLVVGVLVALHEVVVDLLDGVFSRVSSCLRSEPIVQWLDSRCGL